MTTKNRETWLAEAIDVLRDGVFTPLERKLPELHISVGLPHGRDSRGVLIQYFPPKMNADKIGSLFLNPVVDSADQALAVLYGACVKLLPEYGQPLPSSDVVAQSLSLMADTLGAYPNAALKLPDVKKQETRMLKISCRQCGYVCRATSKWTSVGLPSCHCNGKTMQLESRDDIPF